MAVVFYKICSKQVEDKMGHCEPGQIEIEVNTRVRCVAKGSISFIDVVRLAYPEQVDQPNKSFTMTYHYNGNHQDLPLLSGQTIEVKHKMVFVVVVSNNS